MRVALESTVITHGLPYPQNVETAFSMEQIVRDHGGEPATIGILDGQIKIGMTADEIQRLAREPEVFKAGVRELAIIMAQKSCASTTVSATARLAYLNNIHVFATGGIGGVHPGPWDVSMDLFELSRTPIVVVSAGPKAILDLPGTYEMLETIGVTVVGYQTDEMPAFYSRSSGIGLPRANDPAEIADMLVHSVPFWSSIRFLKKMKSPMRMWRDGRSFPIKIWPTLEKRGKRLHLISWSGWRFILQAEPSFPTAGCWKIMCCWRPELGMRLKN